MPRQPARCGTQAGAKRHRANGERACAECRAAEAKASAARRLAAGATPRPPRHLPTIPSLGLPDLPLAVCTEVGPAPWFPVPSTSPADVEEAKAICRGCPERRACLDFALATRAHGIWGGTDERERSSMAKGRAA